MKKRSTKQYCHREEAVGGSFRRMLGKVASEFPGGRLFAGSPGRSAALWH